MKYIIDRIEGATAVCELPDRTMRDIPVEQLPPGMQDGTTLEFDGTTWTVLDTKVDDQRIKRKMDNLWT